MSRIRSRTLTSWLVALAMAVVLSGLPRLLVVCSNSEANWHVEWVHAEGDCCEHDHASASHEAPGDPLAPTAPRATGNFECEHLEFAAELSTPPHVVKFAATAALTAWLDAAQFTDSRAPSDRRRHPSATGPPRPDDRLRLRATTLLLL